MHPCMHRSYNPISSRVNSCSSHPFWARCPWTPRQRRTWGWTPPWSGGCGSCSRRWSGSGPGRRTAAGRSCPPRGCRTPAAAARAPRLPLRAHRHSGNLEGDLNSFVVNISNITNRVICSDLIQFISWSTWAQHGHLAPLSSLWGTGATPTNFVGDLNRFVMIVFAVTVISARRDID